MVTASCMQSTRRLLGLAACGNWWLPVRWFVVAKERYTLQHPCIASAMLLLLLLLHRDSSG